MSRRSHSSSADVTWVGRTKYLFALALMSLKGARYNPNETVESVRSAVEECEERTGKSTSDLRMLEIGFGARPYRSIAFQAFFGDAIGVDLDHPILGLHSFAEARRRNGLLRAIKGLIRLAIFDRGSVSSLTRTLQELYPHFEFDPTRLIVSDASSEEFWELHPGPYDLIYSTDVFEHIPRSDLEPLLKQMKANLADDGIAIISPCVFTGITGGHEPEWYAHLVADAPTERAWRHLWDSDFAVDTYLNKVTRAEYKSMFLEAGMSILSEEAVYADLGRKHLTPEVLNKLSDYEEDELFSNLVKFVLSASK